VNEWKKLDDEEIGHFVERGRGVQDPRLHVKNFLLGPKLSQLVNAVEDEEVRRHFARYAYGAKILNPQERDNGRTITCNYQISS
jgi:hypothetical protein|tara:strand:- start:2286 stop:2537 length:252 start_codon:yes stop_codon:yes gene_type:complete